jgi:hypothetical protein
MIRSLPFSHYDGRRVVAAGNRDEGQPTTQYHADLWYDPQYNV